MRHGCRGKRPRGAAAATLGLRQTPPVNDWPSLCNTGPPPKKQRRSMNMQSPSESCHPLWDSRVLLPVPSTHGVLFNLTIEHNTGFQSKPGTLTSRHLTRRPPGGPRCPPTRCCLCHGSSNCPDPGLTPRGPTYRQALEPDFPWRLGSSVARNAPGATPLPP